MATLKPKDVSLLALLAHRTHGGSTERTKQLVAGIQDPRAQEIAKAILGKRTRSKTAKNTASVIRRWAARA